MKALLDTNVILDVLQRREPHFEASSEVWSAIEKKRLEGAVTSLTMVTVYYVGRKTLGHGPMLENLRRIRDTLEIVGVNAAEVNDAIESGWEDFEDAVQAQAALKASIDWIVTRDPRGFEGSTVPSILPREMVALLRTYGQV